MFEMAMMRIIETPEDKSNDGSPPCRSPRASGFLRLSVDKQQKQAIGALSTVLRWN